MRLPVHTLVWAARTFGVIGSSAQRHRVRPRNERVALASSEGSDDSTIVGHRSCGCTTGARDAAALHYVHWLADLMKNIRRADLKAQIHARKKVWLAGNEVRRRCVCLNVASENETDSQAGQDQTALRQQFMQQL